MKRRELVFHRVFTVKLPPSGDSVTFLDLRLPQDQNNYVVQVWSNGASGVPTFLFRGRVELSDCQGELAQDGIVDVLCSIPLYTVSAELPLSRDTSILTIFGVDQGGTPHSSVTVSVRER